MKKHMRLSVTAAVGARLKARGFSLVTAIFILITLAGLGAAIMRISTVQHISSAQDVQGARAYFAARAGIEWGLYRQLRLSSCPGSASPTSFTLPTATTLGQFTVTVTCVPTAVLTGTLTQYVITSVACNQPTGGACVQGTGNNSTLFIQRVVQVRFSTDGK